MLAALFYLPRCLSIFDEESERKEQLMAESNQISRIRWKLQRKSNRSQKEGNLCDTFSLCKLNAREVLLSKCFSSKAGILELFRFMIT